MSRSYKKVPYCGDHKGKRKKRTANRRVRMRFKNPNFEIENGGAYKKIHETWEICDYYWLTSWEEYWEICQKLYRRFGGEIPNRKEEYRYWVTHYKRK